MLLKDRRYVIDVKPGVTRLRNQLERDSSRIIGRVTIQHVNEYFLQRVLPSTLQS